MFRERVYEESFFKTVREILQNKQAQEKDVYFQHQISPVSAEFSLFDSQLVLIQLHQEAEVVDVIFLMNTSIFNNFIFRELTLD